MKSGTRLFAAFVFAFGFAFVFVFTFVFAVAGGADALWAIEIALRLGAPLRGADFFADFLGTRFAVLFAAFFAARGFFAGDFFVAFFLVAIGRVYHRLGLRLIGTLDRY